MQNSFRIPVFLELQAFPLDDLAMNQFFNVDGEGKRDFLVITL